MNDNPTYKMEGTVPITEEHLKVMCDRMMQAMNGLWAIIEDHGTPEMRKYRDDHLSACGIVMNINDECGKCPACIARAQGLINPPKQRKGTEFVAEIVKGSEPATAEQLKCLLEHTGKGGKSDA